MSPQMLSTYELLLVTGYYYVLIIKITYLVLCSPFNTNDCFVEFEKDARLNDDVIVRRRLSLIMLSSITVMAKFIVCYNKMRS